MLWCLIALLGFLFSSIVSLSFDERVPNPKYPLFVTYTTGANDRISLTLNLLKSLEIHSPRLYSNSIIACLDSKGCEWCIARAQSANTSSKSCYCIDNAVNINASDAYASSYWSAAVIRKVAVIQEFVKSNIEFAIFADHDIVIKASLDEIFDDPMYSTPIISMCDFPKSFRPENKMANTGFMLIRNHPEAKIMIEQWYKLVFNSIVDVSNDQPPFQEIAKRKEFISSHRCADEKEGFAMWFHKKKISGSGLNKNYYMKNSHNFKVFHANDITSCSKKVEVLKKLKMWYLDGSGNVTSNIFSQSSSVEFNASSHTSNSKKTGLFYMYIWPDILTNLTDSKYPSRNENFGAGPIIDASSGQFNSYMHSLFPIVYNRLLIHPLRCFDPLQAQWFFIPYDISSDAYFNLNKGLNQVLLKLQTSLYFMRSNGADHFIFDSSEPFWFEKKAVVSSFYHFCRLCIKFTPSTLPAPYQKWQREFIIDQTFVHIPYTSTWHYYEKSKTIHQQGPWAWDFDVEGFRFNLIAFVGIIKKMVQSATQLRRLLVQQCKHANLHNKLSTDVPYTHLCSINVLDTNAWTDFGGEAFLYRNTTFCLLPTGDIPSRKAVFDMLLAGCIPVLFDRRQLDLYQWHLSEDEIKSIHYFIDIKDTVSSKINVPELLSLIPYSKVLKMRSAIKKVVWKLQYALPPSITPTKSWVPPVIDALETILQKLFAL